MEKQNESHSIAALFGVKFGSFTLDASSQGNPMDTKRICKKCFKPIKFGMLATHMPACLKSSRSNKLVSICNV